MSFERLRRDQGFVDAWNTLRSTEEFRTAFFAIRGVIYSRPTESYDIATNALQNKFTEGATGVFELMDLLGIYIPHQRTGDTPTPFSHIARELERQQTLEQQAAAPQQATKAAQAKAKKQKTNPA